MPTLKPVFALIALSAVIVWADPAPAPAPGTTAAQPATPAKPADPFAPLRRLEGKWTGEGHGQSGDSTVERTYEFTMKGRYLSARNTSTYAPQEKNKNGEKHEDMGMYSFDRARKKLVLRQFHIEGFVNQYVLESISDDATTIVLLTEAIENIPQGFRARETYKFVDNDTLEETFEIAPSGKDFEIYTRNSLKRVK